MSSELVDRAFQEILQTENDRFATLWDELPRSQRLVLKAPATEGDRGIHSEEYRLQHGLGASSTVQAALVALRKKDLVESTSEGYVITDKLLAAWILRHRRRPEPAMQIAGRSTATGE